MRETASKNSEGEEWTALYLLNSWRKFHRFDFGFGLFCKKSDSVLAEANSAFVSSSSVAKAFTSSSNFADFWAALPHNFYFCDLDEESFIPTISKHISALYWSGFGRRMNSKNRTTKRHMENNYVTQDIKLLTE